MSGKAATAQTAQAAAAQAAKWEIAAMLLRLKPCQIALCARILREAVERQKREGGELDVSGFAVMHAACPGCTAAACDLPERRAGPGA